MIQTILEWLHGAWPYLLAGAFAWLQLSLANRATPYHREVAGTLYRLLLMLLERSSWLTSPGALRVLKLPLQDVPPMEPPGGAGGGSDKVVVDLDAKGPPMALRVAVCAIALALGGCSTVTPKKAVVAAQRGLIAVRPLVDDIIDQRCLDEARKCHAKADGICLAGGRCVASRHAWAEAVKLILRELQAAQEGMR